MGPPKPSPIWAALETMMAREAVIEVRGRIGDGPAETIANLVGLRNYGPLQGETIAKALRFRVSGLGFQLPLFF
jgi:hypothetical protein